MLERDLYCAACDAVMLFEAPPCDDDHPDECPELVCTGCGSAVLIAPVTVHVLLRTPGGQVAPHQRRAA